MTKANHILVKIYSKLLYVIQGVKNIFDKVTSWPQLISKFLAAPIYSYLFIMLLLIGLAHFYTQDVFV